MRTFDIGGAPDSSFLDCLKKIVVIAFMTPNVCPDRSNQLVLVSRC